MNSVIQGFSSALNSLQLSLCPFLLFFSLFVLTSHYFKNNVAPYYNNVPLY